jgi:hypothetical protein
MLRQPAQLFTSQVTGFPQQFRHFSGADTDLLSKLAQCEAFRDTLVTSIKMVC